MRLVIFGFVMVLGVVEEGILHHTDYNKQDGGCQSIWILTLTDQ